jgi:hypothetical protein
MAGQVEEPTMDAIRRLLAEAGVGLQQDAEAQLSSLLNSAQAKQLVELPDVPPNSEEALSGLTRLVNEMMRKAQAVAEKGDKPPVVTPQIVDGSLKGLCPLPPWC